MTPLSTIRQLWPGMPPTAAGLPQQGPSAATSIPTAELRALNASDPNTSVQPANASFSGLLDNFVQSVNAKQGAAAQALQDLQNGQNVSLHQAVIAMEEANVSFQLMVEVRNRLLDSYQQLMQMQV